MRKKRRSRGYRKSQRKNMKPNFIPVMLVICLSIGCGYATAKYVVHPAVNYVPETTVEKQSEIQQETSESKTDEVHETSQKSNVVEDDVDVKENGKIEGYAVQFGCYSSKDAAEQAMSSLSAAGLQVVEQNKMYKIIGEIFETKEEAKKSLQSLDNIEKAFVTTVYK